MTPFPTFLGISVIIHFAIILVKKLINLFRKLALPTTEGK
jgi:hypothetical protein